MTEKEIVLLIHVQMYDITEYAKELITHNPIIEDSWFEFNDEIDVNIYLDIDNNPQATAYPVVDGKTISTHGIKLLIDTM